MSDAKNRTDDDKSMLTYPGGDQGGGEGKADPGIYNKPYTNQSMLTQGEDADPGKATPGDGSPTEAPDGTKKEYPRYMAQMPDRYKTNERLAELGTMGGLADDYFAVRGQLEKALERIREFVPEYEPEGEANPTEGETGAITDDVSTESPIPRPGVPESPEGYDLGFGDERFKGLINQEFEQEFRQIAHDFGIPQPVAQALAALQAKYVFGPQLEKMEQQYQDTQAAQDELKQIWKGDYRANWAGVERMLNTYADEATIRLLDGATVDGKRVSDHPGVAVLLSRIYRDAFAESSFAPGSTPLPEPKDSQQKTLEDMYPTMRGEDQIGR